MSELTADWHDFDGATINVSRQGTDNAAGRIQVQPGLLGTLTEGGNAIYNSILCPSRSIRIAAESLNITFNWQQHTNAIVYNSVMQCDWLSLEYKHDDRHLPVSTITWNFNDPAMGADQGTGGSRR